MLIFGSVFLKSFKRARDIVITQFAATSHFIKFWFKMSIKRLLYSYVRPERLNLNKNAIFRLCKATQGICDLCNFRLCKSQCILTILNVI